MFRLQNVQVYLTKYDVHFSIISGVIHLDPFLLIYQIRERNKDLVKNLCTGLNNVNKYIVIIYNG